MESIIELNLPQQDTKRYREPPPDDDEIALELAESWDNKAAFFYGNWHVYETGCWIVRARQQVKKAIRSELRAYRSRGVRVTQRLVNSLAGMMEDECYVPDRDLMELVDAGKKYINLRNGLFNLETFQLEPHNPELFFTSQLDFNYDPDEECPTFRRFLNTSLVKEDGKTDQQQVALVKEALAYSMTARTDLKASFWLVGEKNSGKSTLVGFIRNLMGSLHTTIDLNQLATNRFLLSGIVGKRVVTFTEADRSTPLPDYLYKAMVGGQDEIYADVKNAPAIAFVPQAKFWWAMNNAPRMTDRSGATLARLNVILFNRTIPEPDRILDLDQHLMRERAGVFNELIFAYKRLIRAGHFTRPEQSERWREDYSLENDTERLFIEESAELHPSYAIQSEALYSAYRQYCENNGFKPKNISQVAGEWKRLGFEKRRNQGRTFWHGLMLQGV